MSEPWGMPLVKFTVAMAERLEANEHKGSWYACSPQWLLNRLRQETAELERALSNGGDVIHEAADVANFAMMLADLATEAAGGRRE